MKLAVATGPGIIGKPKFKGNWDVANMASLEELYKKVIELIPQQPYGIFLAAELMFNTSAAYIICKKEGLPIPDRNPEDLESEDEDKDASDGSGSDNE
jgi:hypothetical protein